MRKDINAKYERSLDAAKERPTKVILTNTYSFCHNCRKFAPAEVRQVGSELRNQPQCWECR